MKTSDKLDELAGALALAQKAFKPIIKSETVDYTSVKGRTHYNYAPLSTVIEATKDGLSDNGLAVMQPTQNRDGKVYVETWLCHKSGQWVMCEMYVGEELQSPQSEGSSLSYKRRYSLSSLLNVASEEDDDAQEAEKTHSKTIETSKQTRQDARTAAKSEPPIESLPPTHDEVKAALDKSEEGDVPNKVTRKQLQIIADLRTKKWDYAVACKNAGYGTNFYPTKLTVEQADYLIGEAVREGFMV